MKLHCLTSFTLVVLNFLLGSSPLSAAADHTVVYEPKDGAAGKHVVFLSGDEEYRSEEGLPMLAKILSQRHGFKCTVLFALDPDGTIKREEHRALKTVPLEIGRAHV